MSAAASSPKNGMNYAPTGKSSPVCKPGEFVISAIGLDHAHVHGQCKGLIEAGAVLKWVYDPDPKKTERFTAAFPGVKTARSEDEVLQDPEVRLVASAAVPSERCALGLRVMSHGKHYFTDKAPLTTLEQLAQARAMAGKTGKKYAVYYSERIHTECSVHAGDLIQGGAIGRVVQVIGLGPHRLNAPGRPDWFFVKEKYGGILCDIGSHQIEQYLFFAGVKDATVVQSRIANYAHPRYPGLDDFGDATITGDNGSTNYFRVDWFTPDGLGAWGDGRTIILGTEGFIELRKYIDIGREQTPDHVYLANGQGEHHIPVSGKVGYPFFGRLILDCLGGTETAMTQEHAFKAAELCIKAQLNAVDLTPERGMAPYNAEKSSVAK
jgi:predicted dehydrogenase